MDLRGRDEKQSEGLLISARRELHPLARKCISGVCRREDAFFRINLSGTAEV